MVVSKSFKNGFKNVSKLNLNYIEYYMVAILHCIIESIERDRVRLKINYWRLKTLTAKKAVMDCMYNHFDTSMNTYSDETGIDLWEELREFNFVPVLCAKFPKCLTGIYQTYKYKVEVDTVEGFLVLDDFGEDYDYYCFHCFRKLKIENEL